jgi:hypothetical protein
LDKGAYRFGTEPGSPYIPIAALGKTKEHVMHDPTIAYAARRSFFVGRPGQLHKQKLESNFCTTVHTDPQLITVAQLRAMPKGKRRDNRSNQQGLNPMTYCLGV